MNWLAKSRIFGNEYQIGIEFKMHYPNDNSYFPQFDVTFDRFYAEVFAPYTYKIQKILVFKILIIKPLPTELHFVESPELYRYTAK